MYNVIRNKKGKNDLEDNHSDINGSELLILLFTCLCIGFGILVGHFLFPIDCKDCKTIVQEQRVEGNAYIDFVSGTEYIANIGGLDTGQVIVRVVDYKGNPLNASCNATILNPDKTYYMISEPMSSSAINGNYYKTFTIPTTTGIFEDYVNCSVQLGTKTLYTSKSSSFHVAPILTLFQNISTQISLLNQTVVDGNNMLNNTINYVHQDILANINGSASNLNATLTQIINDMSTYYSNLDMKLDNVTSTVVNLKVEILNAIKSVKSDIVILQEWFSYMFGKITGTSTQSGQSWLEKIIGRKVNLPDVVIPRPD